MFKFTCPACGAAFQRDRRKAKYCSPSCRSQSVAYPREAIRAGVLARIVPLDQRLWRRVDKTDTCWVWCGATSDFGHGEIREGARGSRCLRTHVVSWEIANGPVPEGLCVLHKCDVPACVRPDHLFLGTKRDNWQDMMKKGRYDWDARAQPVGVDHHNAKLDEEKVLRARQEFYTGKRTIDELAQELQVSDTTVRGFLNGTGWRHVDGLPAGVVERANARLRGHRAARAARHSA